MARIIKTGCCGFPVAKTKYFNAFGVVELQQTFYQPPEDHLIEKWRKESPEGFEYTLKAWQLITHEPKSPTYRKLKMPIPSAKEKHYGSFRPTDEVSAAWTRTKDVAELLGARIIVFQCPPSFGPTAEHRKNLVTFFTTAQRKNFTLAWEPRGTWNDGDIESLCRELDLVHVVDPLKAAATFGEMRYYRLHGIGGYKYKYSDSDLAKLKKIADDESPEMEMYFMFNNVYMYDDALAFDWLIREGKPKDGANAVESN